jgi:hypothetical protein
MPLLSDPRIFDFQIIFSGSKPTSTKRTTSVFSLKYGRLPDVEPCFVALPPGFFTGTGRYV